MFKYYAKGDKHDNESALFYNGQRLFSIYATVDSDGTVNIDVYDGSDKHMTMWTDYLEENE